MKYLLYFLFIGLLISACKKEEAKEQPTSASTLDTILFACDPYPSVPMDSLVILYYTSGQTDFHFTDSTMTTPDTASVITPFPEEFGPGLKWLKFIYKSDSAYKITIACRAFSSTNKNELVRMLFIKNSNVIKEQERTIGSQHGYSETLFTYTNNE